MGRPKTGHTERVEVRVSPELLDMIERGAEREDVSLTEWFRRAAHAYLTKQPTPTTKESTQ